ncbi:flagellar export protein FliJ [Priestia koreensis]|uniref:flagellar export protein FliJ n=1 Tax=Priestia koreensis TaxID=284581 RepID=UPI001F5AD6FA|nr:flagellar export protein FliJ [Priestia koreensis]MCM3003772.1 flagellar export protein FliJ [Priestia koreensis]UNL83880.1 flagellar export protein FliJ [Priestia koreensis]
MVYQFKFSKIMSIKENEKERILNEYNEAVERFETVGQRLYDALKHKEQQIEAYNRKMMNGMSITELKQVQAFLERTERLIEGLQKEVISARQYMQTKQFLLQEKNIEMKKYEKMKANDFHLYQEIQKSTEAKQMDEISLQQYMLKEK